MPGNWELPQGRAAGWTKEQLDVEWIHIYTERLGLMIDGVGTATDEQHRIAREEADKHVAALASTNPP